MPIRQNGRASIAMILVKYSDPHHVYQFIIELNAKNVHLFSIATNATVCSFGGVVQYHLAIYYHAGVGIDV